MKCVSMLGLLQAIALFGFGQHASVSDISTTSGDRLSLVQNSVDIPSWHEKRFWTLYDKYEKVHEQVSLSVHRALHDVSKIDASMSDTEALDLAQKLIKYRREQFNTLSEYYQEMGDEFNGVVAYQFLQAEALMDIMDGAKIYEDSPWRNYRFNRKTLKTAQPQSAKYNIIAAAVGLTPEQAGAFYALYYQYEHELDAVLGEDYSMYSLFSGEPGDFTPGLAKRWGQNLMLVMQREMRLKEKYFNKMKTAVGASLATRFLAWEDYYSLTSKMQAWSEND
jgi:hypothetical protein